MPHMGRERISRRKQKLGCCHEGRHSRSGCWRGSRGQSPSKWARARVPARVRACSAGSPAMNSLCACTHAGGTQRQATNVPAPHEAKSASASSTHHLPLPVFRSPRQLRSRGAVATARQPRAPSHRRARQRSRSTSIVLRARMSVACELGRGSRAR